MQKTLDSSKMFQVDTTNHSKYNFSGTLENQLKHNLRKGDHETNYYLLHDHFQQLLNTIKVFGDDKTTQKLLIKFVEMIEFNTINFHKPKAFYNVMTEFRQYSHNPWPSTNFGVETCIKLLEVVLSQSIKNYCPHGCCK